MNRRERRQRLFLLLEERADRRWPYAWRGWRGAVRRWLGAFAREDHPLVPWWLLRWLDDRHPDWCWPSLVMWKISDDDTAWEQRGCREDCERDGSCYCGKLTTPEFRAKLADREESADVPF